MTGRSYPPLWRLITAQIKEFYRNPEVLFWVLLFPIGMAWVLGIAFSGNTPTQRSIAVVVPVAPGNDRFFKETEASRPGGGEFQVRRVASREEALHLLKRGEVSLFVERGVSDDDLVYSFDPKNEDSLLSYYRLRNVMEKGDASRRGGRIVPLQEAGSRYIDFLIPGLLAMGIMNSAFWGIGWGLIEYRMKKLLRRMAATPMRKIDFFLSQVATRMLLSGFEFSALLIVAYLLLGVRVQGGFLPLATAFLGGNICFAGVAVLIASRTDNSRTGNGLINFATMPMMLLSGIFFSYSRFPAWIRPALEFLPLSMLADSMRAVIVEGAGLEQILFKVTLLVIVGIASATLGLRIFRWS